MIPERRGGKVKNDVERDAVAGEVPYGGKTGQTSQYSMIVRTNVYEH